LHKYKLSFQKHPFQKFLKRVFFYKKDKIAKNGIEKDEKKLKNEKKLEKCTTIVLI